jgi:hypothetical protein
VKAVGESAMRVVIGRSNIQAILTGARQTLETAVQEIMRGAVIVLAFYFAPGAVTASYLPRCCHYLGKAWRCQSRRQINLVRGYA